VCYAIKMYGLTLLYLCRRRRARAKRLFVLSHVSSAECLQTFNSARANQHVLLPNSPCLCAHCALHPLPHAEGRWCAGACSFCIVYLLFLNTPRVPFSVTECVNGLRMSSCNYSMNHSLPHAGCSPRSAWPPSTRAPASCPARLLRCRPRLQALRGCCLRSRHAHRRQRQRHTACRWDCGWVSWESAVVTGVVCSKCGRILSAGAMLKCNRGGTLPAGGDVACGLWTRAV
jgi:hypothetical protein